MLEVKLKILLIGGTGFLGYHATKELSIFGHQVNILALPPGPPPGVYPEEVKIHLADMSELSDEQLQSLLRGNDAVVFAAGVDDRVTPRKPAYPFFCTHNVEGVRRVFTLARSAGVRRGVVLGSYFAYFDRLWPEMTLSIHHPYIRSRVEQAKVAIEAGGNEMSVSILELPYIFGSMPGKTPLWKPLIRYVISSFPLLYPAGGTTCVSVNQVAQAIRGAVEHGEPGKSYPIGGTNLTWIQLLEEISRLAGKQKRVITLPTWLVKIGAWCLKIVHDIKGLESGLEPVAFIDLQTRNTFIDSHISQATLHYNNEELTQALTDTVNACVEPEG
jgi:nucleoside-diphosphate-sugar epimerase